MSSRYRIVLCGILVVCAGCGGPRPRDLILGKWLAQEAPPDTQVTLEFKPDGTVTTTTVGGALDETTVGRYQFRSDDIMELQEAPGRQTREFKVEIADTRLTLTELAGTKRELRYDRLK